MLWNWLRTFALVNARPMLERRFVVVLHISCAATPTAATAPKCFGAAPKSNPISMRAAALLERGNPAPPAPRPPRLTISATGVAARQPSVGAPGQPWEPIACIAE